MDAARPRHSRQRRGARGAPRPRAALHDALPRAILLAVSARPALEEARAGLQLARQAGHRRAEVRCIRAAALDLELRAYPDCSAVVLLRQAEQLSRQARDRSVRAEVLLRLGGALRAGADFGAAKAAFDSALIEAKASNNALALGSANTSYGALSLQLNDYVTAAGYLRAAVSTFEAQGDTGSAMTARQFLTDLHFATGDLNRARAQALELLEWWEHVEEVVAQIEMHRCSRRSGRDATGHRRTRVATVRTWRSAMTCGVGGTIRVDRAAGARPRRPRPPSGPGHYIAGLAPTRNVLRHEAPTRRAAVYARRGGCRAPEREMAAAAKRSTPGRDARDAISATRVPPTRTNERRHAAAHGAARSPQRRAAAASTSERRRGANCDTHAGGALTARRPGPDSAYAESIRARRDPRRPRA